jgi:hypothetical protein
LGWKKSPSCSSNSDWNYIWGYNFFVENVFKSGPRNILNMDENNPNPPGIKYQNVLSCSKIASFQIKYNFRKEGLPRWGLKPGSV